MRSGFLAATLLVVFAIGCGKPIEPSDTVSKYRIAYDPYSEVDWDSDPRCLTQFHDHVVSASRFERFLLPYNSAGYHAVSPMHYSGDPSHPDAWRQRYWPVSESIEGVASDSELLQRFENLRLLIPGGEEVGFHHVLSPFLDKYIEKGGGRLLTKEYPWQYESTQDCIDRIREGGGIAVLAHPWEPIETYDRLTGFQAIEVFSGYAHHKHAVGERGDDNARFLELWDHLLSTQSTRIWGIGVNDWFGPGRSDILEEHPTHVDAGKTILFIKEWTLESLRDAFERGAMAAVKDTGAVKGEFPEIDRIASTLEGITVETDSEVRWISKGRVLATDSTLSLSGLPEGLRYIRGEIHNATGTVFLQPFTLEPAPRASETNPSH